MTGLGDDMDLPFQHNPGGPTDIELPDGQFSGGYVVMAGVIPVPDVGPRPALIFRFAKPTGGFMPPIVLVLEPDQMAKAGQLVTVAATAALSATHRVATAQAAAHGRDLQHCGATSVHAAHPDCDGYPLPVTR